MVPFKMEGVDHNEKIGFCEPSVGNISCGSILVKALFGEQRANLLPLF